MSTALETPWMPATHTSALPLYGPEYWSDPAKTFERLQRVGDVAPVWLGERVPAWMVTNYETLLRITRAPETWSRDSRIWDAWRSGVVAEDSPLLEMMRWRPNALFADGQEHARLRRAVVESLASLDLEQLRETTVSLADQLIDDFCVTGRADLVGQFTELLPLLLVAAMFGLERHKALLLAEMVKRIWDGNDAARASADLERLLGRLIARKRATPAADLTSLLIRHHAGLTSEELVEQLMLLISAAQAPTAGLIANALTMLLTEKAVRNDLDNGWISAGGIIDLALWLHTPMSVYPFVYARRTVTVGDFEIPAGAAVGLGLAAANLSAARRTDPRRLVGNRGHASFGAGAHSCPASGIAHEIAKIAVMVLLQRLRGIKLAEPVQWRASVFMHAPNSLRVTFPVASPTVHQPEPESGNPHRIVRPSTSSLTRLEQTQTPRRRTSAGTGRLFRLLRRVWGRLR